MGKKPPRIDRPSVGLKRTPPEKAKRSVPSHLRWLRTLPCAVCGHENYHGSEAAHIRCGTDAGVGIKPHDKHTTPLCPAHHREQHSVGEITFWSRHKVDPVQLAERLWRVSGDTEQGLRAIERAHQSARLKQGVE